MTDLRVALTTSLNDRLVGPLRRSLDEVEKNLKGIEKELVGVTKASDQAGRTLTSIQGPAQAARQVMDLSKNTQNAIGLAERLRSVWSATGSMIRGVTTGVAAFQAAKYVVAQPLRTARTYERQLADAANIAYNYGQRTQGMAEMNTSVVGAVRAGGGTRESALKAMNDLFAANIDKDVVQSLLPVMQKYATAGNADPANIAQLVIYGLRSVKLPPDQIPLMLDKTLASTKQGSMEFDSLAKWMPQVGAAGASAGLTGMKGYEYMLAGVQTSRLTAGTKDEAGTNFKDLLALINGHALMTAAHRIGIDATGALAKHIGNGGNAITGIVGLADFVANSDPRFAALDKRMKASNVKRDKSGQPIYTPEQEDIMRQQATLFQGSALGKLFHNQQSMQALVALRNNRDFFSDQLAGTAKAVGQIGTQDFETIQGTADFKVSQVENERLFAVSGPAGSVNAALGRLAEQTTELYQKYPALGAAMETTKLALTALAAAAGAAGLAQLATGGGALAGGIAGVAGTVASRGLKLGVAGLAGAAGYAVGSQIYDHGLADNAGGDTIGGGIAKLLALLGNDDAKTAVASREKYEQQMQAERTAMATQTAALAAIAQRPIQVVIDGREVASSVNKRNEWLARRN